MMNFIVIYLEVFKGVLESKDFSIECFWYRCIIKDIEYLECSW